MASFKRLRSYSWRFQVKHQTAWNTLEHVKKHKQQLRESITNKNIREFISHHHDQTPPAMKNNNQ